MDDPESAARSSVRRSALLYGSFLAGAVLVVAYMASAATSAGHYVTLSIVGAVGVLLAYQTWLYVADIRSAVVEKEGVVERKWRRNDFVIAWESFYIGVDRTIFKIAPEEYLRVEEGKRVKVMYLPRTLTVVSVHETPRSASDGAA